MNSRIFTYGIGARKHQDKIVGGERMHDDYIIGYSVDLKEKDMVILTYNNKEKKQNRICFSEVLTHCFECIIEYNIIFDVQECEICNFVKDNKDKLIKMKGYCWPVAYQTEEELINFLSTNEYKYIKINSSYGMSGWVLAKSYEICK